MYKFCHSREGGDPSRKNSQNHSSCDLGSHPGRKIPSQSLNRDRETHKLLHQSPSYSVKCVFLFGRKIERHYQDIS